MGRHLGLTLYQGPDFEGGPVRGCGPNQEVVGYTNSIPARPICGQPIYGLPVRDIKPKPGQLPMPQPGGGTDAQIPTTPGAGFDFSLSNPVVLIGLAAAAFFLLKK